MVQVHGAWRRHLPIASESISEPIPVPPKDRFERFIDEFRQNIFQPAPLAGMMLGTWVGQTVAMAPCWRFLPGARFAVGFALEWGIFQATQEIFSPSGRTPEIGLGGYAALMLQSRIALHWIRPWLPNRSPLARLATKGEPAWLGAAAQADASKSGSYPVLPPRLVRALIHRPNYRTHAQSQTIEALQRLFRYDAANSPQGSWQNALWRDFLGRALADPSAEQGQRALLAALSVMETAPRPDALALLAARFDYRNPIVSEAEWIATREQVLRYPRKPGGFALADLEKVLAAARHSPQGGLMLKRLRHLLAHDDLPAKLREFFPDYSAATEAIISGMSELDIEPAALWLAGSAHVAYLDDPRLARKVLSVYREIDPYLKNWALRARNRARIEGQFAQLAERFPGIGPPAFEEFLKSHDDSQARALSRHLTMGRLKIEFLDGARFDREVKRFGLPENCRLAFFLKSETAHYPHLIKLRSMSDWTDGNLEVGIDEFTSRLIALFHEWEHYRHFTGYFDPRESHSLPFDIAKLTREERIVSETMAVLEQLRWTLKHWDDDFYQVARRLGENLPQLARSMVDYALARSWK